MSQRPSWEEIFMINAIIAGIRSSCLKRQVGAVLIKDKRVIASGYNGAPPGVETCLDVGECFYEALAHKDSTNGNGLGTFEILREERKIFCSAVHAEKNAINQCSIYGMSAVGEVLYITKLLRDGMTERLDVDPSPYFNTPLVHSYPDRIEFKEKDIKKISKFLNIEIPTHKLPGGLIPYYNFSLLEK